MKSRMRSIRNYCFPCLFGILLFFDFCSVMICYNSCICGYSTSYNYCADMDDHESTSAWITKKTVILSSFSGMSPMIRMRPFWVPLTASFQYYTQRDGYIYLSLYRPWHYKITIGSSVYTYFNNPLVATVRVHNSTTSDFAQPFNVITDPIICMGIGPIESVVSTRNDIDNSSFKCTDKTFECCKLDVINSGYHQMQEMLIMPEMHHIYKLSQDKLDSTWIPFCHLLICTVISNTTAPFIYHKVIKWIKLIYMTWTMFFIVILFCVVCECDYILYTTYRHTY